VAKNFSRDRASQIQANKATKKSKILQQKCPFWLRTYFGSGKTRIGGNEAKKDAATTTTAIIPATTTGKSKKFTKTLNSSEIYNN